LKDILRMNQVINIYCDESCHMEHDGQKIMVLGAIWCPKEQVPQIHIDIRKIKREFALSEKLEIKWTKVSPGKFNFYAALLDYFYKNPDLHFRAWVITDKTNLDHEKFSQTYDAWYYKMYFDLLKVILNPSDRYRIYLDIKDTRGGTKVNKLHEVLCNNMYDFDHKIIERVQIIRSYESEILQIADLLIGAVAAVNRDQIESSAKKKFVELFQSISGYSLKRPTLLQENKTNLYFWNPKRG
jgi:hypothetical protein